MKKFSIHGTEEGNTTSIKLVEIAILADPDTLLKIGEFIIKTAHVMKGYEVDYSQLQDEVSILIIKIIQILLYIIKIMIIKMI